MIRIAVLAMTMLMALAAQAQTEIVPTYVNGLAAPNWGTMNTAVPPYSELNIDRYDVNAYVGEGSRFALTNLNANVWGDGNFYGDVRFITRWGGSGVAVSRTNRLHCMYDSVGYCIAHKTALRNYGQRVWGNWLEQYNVGPGVNAVFWITGDVPLYGEKAPYPVDRIMVVQDDLIITDAVIQWNKANDSDGDFLRMIRSSKEGGGYAFRVDANGMIWIGGVSLPDYIRSVR